MQPPYYQQPPGQHPSGQQPGGYPPQQGSAGQRPNKGKNRGCWIVAFSGCGLLLVAFAVGSYFVYQAAKDAPVGDIMWAVGEGAEAIQEAQRAPGTKALRKEGCTQAMAIDFKRFGKIAERFDAGVPKGEQLPKTIVSCSLGFTQDTHGERSCDHFAKVYLDGGGTPGGPFTMSISKSGRNEPVCTRFYEEDGTPTQDHDTKSP